MLGGPLLSVNELLTATTGIDWSSVPKRNASATETAQEARRMIARATSWATGYCSQVLWATQEVEQYALPGRRANFDSNGNVIVFTRETPIIAVDLVEFTADGASYTPVMGNPVILKGPEKIPDYFIFANSNVTRGSRGFLRVTYRAGYPNAKLAADALFGATSITIDDPMGILPLDRLQIYDDADQEEIIVAAGYVQGSAVLPLTTPLLFAHATGIAVSAMAERIREAVIKYATDLVRQRGKDAVALLPSGGAKLVSGSTSSKVDDAKNDLNPHRSIL